MLISLLPAAPVDCLEHLLRGVIPTLVTTGLDDL